MPGIWPTADSAVSFKDHKGTGLIFYGSCAVKSSFKLGHIGFQSKRMPYRGAVMRITNLNGRRAAACYF
jgi:hypothetical protein